MAAAWASSWAAWFTPTKKPLFRSKLHDDEASDAVELTGNPLELAGLSSSRKTAGATSLGDSWPRATPAWLGADPLSGLGPQQWQQASSAVRLVVSVLAEQGQQQLLSCDSWAAAAQQRQCRSSRLLWCV